MKSITRALTLVVLLGGCATKTADNPRLELTDVGFALHLPAPMQQALDSVAPGFKVVRASSFRSDVAQAAGAGGVAGAAAFAALGDWNHDGALDAVVEGASPGSSSLTVIAILNGPHPSAIEVTRFAEYDADAVGIYLTGAPPNGEATFSVVAYPDSTLVYRWVDGKLEGHTIRQ